jgi:peroxiredoxin
MRSITTAFLIAILFSCSSGGKKSDDTITISGKIDNVGVGAVTLELFSENTLDAVDTLTVNDDGTYFSTHQPDEPGYYRLNFYQTQFVNLLFTGDPVEVNVDGSNPTSYFEIKNSEEMDHINALNTLMESFQSEVSTIQEGFSNAARERDTVKMKMLRDDYMNRQEELGNQVKEKIRSMGTTIALLQAVNYLDKEVEFDFIDSIARVVEKEIPDYKIKRDFISEMERLRKLAIGALAPEISLPDPEGNIVTLSSLRGSYVLIDFWAAWCGPCRKENPNVLKLYKKYHDKGFEIYGVSLDRTKEDWLKAIEADGLIWPQVSDLKYFQSVAALDYNINSIPATILLDKEGKIIAKNLRGKILEQKLAELF